MSDISQIPLYMHIDSISNAYYVVCVTGLYVFLMYRCNGWYSVSIPPKGYRYPRWLLKNIQQRGYTVVEICGLTEDQCDYVKQAATQAKIFWDNGESQNADILHVDFYSSQMPVLLAGMKCSEGNVWSLAAPVCEVQFQLKHSYFRNLHRAVECVSEVTIAKLFPSKESFVSYPEFAIKVPLKRPSMDQFSLDYDYQLDTMKDVLFCHPSAPFIITGPFGTGKTRMLATAAFMILKHYGRRAKGDPIRVLLVTHHVQTADSYLDLYFGPAVQRRELANGSVVRLISMPEAQFRYDGNYGKFISSVNEQQGSIHRYQLVITTFLTSLHLVSQCSLHPGFFTHILVDEAAQAREPEVVAALALADRNTKIVLTGDHLQVGTRICVYSKKKMRSRKRGVFILKCHWYCVAIHRRLRFQSSLKGLAYEGFKLLYLVASVPKCANINLICF